MEDPVRDIPAVISALTQSAPKAQKEAIEQYFTRNASFSHPFCKTGSWDGSRDLIGYIYRWYKILSPRIDLQVDSVAFDEPKLLLYVSLHQTFRIQFLPFHRSDVQLVTVLSLTRTPSLDPNLPPTQQPLKLLEAEVRPKYYITAQNDLYQTSEFVKFVLPWLGIGTLLVQAWQVISTVNCVLLAIICWPITWVEQNVWGANRKGSLVEVVHR